MSLDQLDAARQCKWTANNWSHLSIVNFHENPFGGESMYQGADPQARLYLRDCVLGYRMFLMVYYTAAAATLFEGLLNWFEDPAIHRDRRFDAEFIRARVDRMLVDFWSEVRFAGSQSPRFGQFSFAREGDIWSLFSAYESELLSRLSNDPYPHSVFYHQSGGEYWKISGDSSRVVHASGSSRSSTGSHKSGVSICPYHLFHLLQVAKTDGTPCQACTRGSSCQSPHVALNTITMAQAIQAVAGTAVGHITMANALQRISAEHASFKV